MLPSKTFLLPQQSFIYSSSKFLCKKSISRRITDHSCFLLCLNYDFIPSNSGRAYFQSKVFQTTPILSLLFGLWSWVLLEKSQAKKTTCYKFPSKWIKSVYFCGISLTESMILRSIIFYAGLLLQLRYHFLQSLSSIDSIPKS